MNTYYWQPYFSICRCRWIERRRVGALAPVDDPHGIGLTGDLAAGRWEYRTAQRKTLQ